MKDKNPRMMKAGVLDECVRLMYGNKKSSDPGTTKMTRLFLDLGLPLGDLCKLRDHLKIKVDE